MVGGVVQVGTEKKESGNMVDAHVMNKSNADDNYDTEITWAMVGGFIMIVCIAVGCNCLCLWCKKRKI